MAKRAKKLDKAEREKQEKEGEAFMRKISGLIEPFVESLYKLCEDNGTPLGRFKMRLDQDPGEDQPNRKWSLDIGQKRKLKAAA